MSFLNFNHQNSVSWRESECGLLYHLLDLCSNFCCLRLAHELLVCLIFGCNVVVQEIKPSFSCSLNGSTYVKDIRWRKKPENSFLALSNVGKLYRGGVNGPLEDVMDNVDAGMYFYLPYL